MLTRLQVSGFKNLVDVDVRFGPFTCIAGANGAGKSNLFDAIGFLSALSESTFVEAARSVRDGKTVDIANLFHRNGVQRVDRMRFTAEMIIPEHGTDDLGQEAEASITFLSYTLELGYQAIGGEGPFGKFVLLRESLNHFKIGDAKRNLLFPHSKEWRQSAIKGRRTVPFISTITNEADGWDNRIELHQDRGAVGGRPTKFRAASLPRTVLSSVNATESRTAVLARREMQSWRRLQLEPAALREPDTFTPTARLGSNGAHLPATLYHLAHGNNSSDGSEPALVYAQVADRLTDLIRDVRDVGVDEDVQRELWTLYAIGADGTRHSARALSDGTLRFLALAVIDLDPNAQGVLCLEEPENGIHPARIPAMLKLLQAIAVDAKQSIGRDNPLRQVIINTHSPAVVQEAPEDSLVFVKVGESVQHGERFTVARFLALTDTWRTTESDPQSMAISLGDILNYLQGVRPIPFEPDDAIGPGKTNRTAKPRRVADRPDLQRLLSFGDDKP